MNLSITARGYKAPDRLKSYITTKLEKKQKLYEGVVDTDVILSYEKQTQVAEIKLQLQNKTIFVREKSDDIFKSIDLAINTTERQVKRFKEKRRDHDNERINDKIAV